MPQTFTHTFLRVTQVHILLNSLCQIFWVTHLNFPEFIVLNLDQVEVLVIIVVALIILSSIPQYFYLYKKDYKTLLVVNVIQLICYCSLLFVWNQLIHFRLSLENYQTIYNYYLLVSVLPGFAMRFSRSREMTWIKRAGSAWIIVTMLTALLYFSELIGSNYNLEIWRTVIAYCAFITPVFLFLNLNTEISLLPKINDEIIDVD